MGLLSMILTYVRHGDPIYTPDSLTPLGERQAEAVGRRLASHGVDRIFASTSGRAILTAKPTCEMLKKDMTTLDFCNEKYAWEELAIEINGFKTWFPSHDEVVLKLTDPDVIAMGHDWVNHPYFKPFNLGKGIERIRRETDEWLKGLGYEHIPYTGKYKIISPNSERVALFAHWGFGMAFLSTLLDIPYTVFINHFDMCHTGMTVIEFKEIGEYAVPKILTFSNDSHIYKEGLPTKYNNEIYF